MKIKILVLVAVVTILVLLAGWPATAQGPVDQEGRVTAQDVVTADDHIVQGSICTGFDCVNNESFGFDTFILKENNLRIYFNDTSVGSFPTNDWRITVNDSASGGPSYFRIDDATNNVSALTILPLGNVGIGTNTPSAKLHVAGNVLVNGNVTETSDVNSKENFAPVDGEEVLSRLNNIPITTWNYKTDPPAVRHIGPMAQDFYAAFGLGQDDRHIASLDTNGVALAAIKELSQQLQARDAQITQLQQQNLELAARLTALEKLVEQLGQK